MKNIWKYPIKITDEQFILIPENSKPLHAGFDPQGQPCIWMEVYPDNDKRRTGIYVVGTGNGLPERARVHIGSFQDRPFMWHIYSD